MATPNFTAPETEYVPIISRGLKTPITNVGSGNASLGNATVTPTKSGSGLAGALTGAALGTVAGSVLGSNPLGQLTTAAKNMMTGTATKPTTSTPAKTPQTAGAQGQPQGIGSVQSFTLPATITAQDAQAYIDAKYPPVNGQSQYTPSGVNLTTGQIVATPNYNISPSYNTSSGTATGVGQDTSTSPTATTSGYFQDAQGNIYDGQGNLYAVNNNGTYYVNEGNGVWMDANTYDTVDQSTAYGLDNVPTYDPSMTASDVASTDTSGQNFDPYSGTYYKEGGLATPLFKKGGNVKHYLGGGAVIDPNSTSGYSVNGQASDANGNLVDSTGSVLSSLTSATPADSSTGGTSGITDWLSSLVSPTSGGATSGALSGIQGILSNGTVQGTLLGALLGQIMNSSSGGTNQGVDMSKVGNIAPRTTSFGVGPANFVTYGNYGQPVQETSQYDDLFKNMGVSGYTPTSSTLTSGLPKPTTTHYTFGTPVNPLDHLADGGQPMNTNVPMMNGAPSNSNVPVLQGRKDYRKGSYVEGAGDGQSDDIPAMLADGEYVIDADVVAALGNGSNKAGAKVLDGFRENIRKQKRSAPLGSIPPKAKSPLAYLKGAK